MKHDPGDAIDYNSPNWRLLSRGLVFAICVLVSKNTFSKTNSRVAAQKFFQIGEMER